MDKNLTVGSYEMGFLCIKPALVQRGSSGPKSSPYSSRQEEALLLQHLAKNNEGRNTFVLANAQGIVLRVFPEPGDGGERVRPGHVKREIRQGTSAIATALFIREPVEIVTEEPYCRLYHNRICAAAPIFRAKLMAGAISVTSAGGTYHHHTLPLVQMAAKTIMEQMRLREMLAGQKALIEMMDDGIVLFRGDGVISAANARAVSILGLKPLPRARRCARYPCFTPQK